MINKKFFKLFFAFTIPSAIGMLVNSLYVVADGIFISRGIGSIGIAAVNIGYPIINLTAALSLMFGMGGATLISLNKDNLEYKNICFSSTIFLNLFFYILIAGIVFLFPEPIIRSMGGTESLMPMVKKYLYPCILASFFLMLSISLNAIVRNDNAPRKAMFSLFIGATTNIILDYFFIFKFKMGIEGGAYATAIAQIFSAIYLCFHFPNSTFKLSFKNLNFKVLKNICNIGFSSFVLEFAVMVITIVLNIVLSKYEGKKGIAAYGIISYAFVVYRMFFTGFAQGIQPLVSFNYGKKLFKYVLKLFYLAHKVCFIFAIIALILAKLFALDIVKIFTTESNLFNYTANGLFLYSSAIIFVGINFINISYLQAMNRAFLANFIAICRGIVFMIISVLVLPKFLGINGIWLALPFADFLTFILTIFIFWKLSINKSLEKNI